MSVWINTKIQATIRCNPHLAKDGVFKALKLKTSIQVCLDRVSLFIN